MSLLQVVVLALVQGLAELLPVSSSAHVVVVEKLMGLDPSSPQMTLLLVMLHTGIMFAVMAFFWKTWKEAYFSSTDAFKRFALLVLWATVLTGIVGEGLKKIIEKTFFRGAEKAEIEQLFSHLALIAPALAAVGILILAAGLLEKRRKITALEPPNGTVSFAQAGWMRSGAGVSAAVSRSLSIRLDHLSRHAGRRNQAACRTFQLRAGGGPHARSGGNGIVAVTKRVALSSDRPASIADIQRIGDVFLFFGRTCSPQMAKQLA